MTGVIATIPKHQFFDNTGNPAVGHKLYTYLANSLTPSTTWQNQALSSANTNPIILDARGECDLWLADGQEYKFILKTSADVVVWTVDDISGPFSAASVTAQVAAAVASMTAYTDDLRSDLAASSGSSLVGFIQPGTGAGARTVQAKDRESVSAADFTGFDATGVADSTTAIANAFAQLGAAGGSVTIPNGAKVLIDSNLTIPANCHLVGPHIIVGSPNNNASAPYGSVGGALMVNSTKTITIRGGASLRGLLLYRKGMTFPAADSSAFAGTAITLGGDDAAVFQCMLLGFAQAITSSNCQRPRLYDNNIDCTAGILIDNCADITYVTRNHCWPFATIAALGAASTLQRSGAAFKFTTLGDWNKLTDNFCYGYARGYLANNCNSMSFVGCSADSTGSFAGQIGFMADGTSTDTRFVACQAAAQEVGFRIATTAGVHSRLIGCDSWACTNHGVLIDSGDVYISGGIQRNTGNGVTVNNASSAVFVDEVRFSGIAGLPINVAVGNSSTYIGSNNDFGDYAAGNSVTNNTNKTAPNLTGADPLNLPARGEFFVVTGNTGFGTLNGGWAGRRVTLKFTGTPTISDGGSSMKLAGNFVATADDTLSLIHDGTAWFETARSAN